MGGGNGEGRTGAGGGGKTGSFPRKRRMTERIFI